MGIIITGINVFLKDLFDGSKPPTKFQNKLRTCFKDMANKLEEKSKII